MGTSNDSPSVAVMPDRSLTRARGSRSWTWLPFAVLASGGPKSIPLQRPSAERMGAQDAMRLAMVCVQLALVLLVIYQYQLESRTFFNVMALGFAGFVVHALLPLQYRLSLFVGLSLAAIVVAFGPIDVGSLILLGILLIGVWLIPLRQRVRLSLLSFDWFHIYLYYFV